MRRSRRLSTILVRLGEAAIIAACLATLFIVLDASS